MTKYGEGLLAEANVASTTIRLRLELRRFFRNRLFLLGTALLIPIVVLSIAAPLFTVYDPVALATNNSLQPMSYMHPFGTDELGRDVFSRIIYGGRVSLRVGFLCAVFTTSFGVLFGTFAGYYRVVDGLISRVVDGFMAFPGLIMAIMFMAALGPSEMNVIFAMTVLYTPRVVRVVRASVLMLLPLDFIDAARVIGASDARILFRHIVPNAIAPIIVQATFGFASGILAQAGMAFLGLGNPPPAPSWGSMLSEGRSFIRTAPWLMFFPGLAISIAVMGLNFIGDGVRDLMDPRLK